MKKARRGAECSSALVMDNMGGRGDDGVVKLNIFFLRLTFVLWLSILPRIWHKNGRRIGKRVNLKMKRKFRALDSIGFKVGELQVTVTDATAIEVSNFFQFPLTQRFTEYIGSGLIKRFLKMGKIFYYEAPQSMYSRYLQNSFFFVHVNNPYFKFSWFFFLRRFKYDKYIGPINYIIHIAYCFYCKRVRTEKIRIFFYTLNSFVMKCDHECVVYMS